MGVAMYKWIVQRADSRVRYQHKIETESPVAREASRKMDQLSQWKARPAIMRTDEVEARPDIQIGFPSRVTAAHSLAIDDWNRTARLSHSYTRYTCGPKTTAF